MTARIVAEDELLTPAEVAALFRVHTKTVTCWAKAGKIGSIRTPGNHRRFKAAEVRALLHRDSVLSGNQAAIGAALGAVEQDT